MPRAATKGQSSYIPALDGLRAIAFLFVFVAHTTGNTISRYVPATFGVTVFFFLSGYLITTLLRGEFQKTGTIALKDFYIRRALRIFVPMYIAYAAAALLAGIFHSGSLGDRRGFWSAILYIYNYMRLFPPAPTLPQGFDVIWSLSVEEHFYILFPLLYLTLMRRRTPPRKQIAIILALCLAGVCWRTFVDFHHFPVLWTYYATDCRFDSILWGSLLALWNNPRFDPAPLFLQRHGGALAALSCGTIVATMFLQSLTFRDTVRYTIQGIGLYFIFRFAIASIGHWSVHWLENRALRYLGWLSYSLYLIHRPIEDAVVPHLPAKDWLISLVSFALSLAYAIAIRHTVELPLQRLRARFRHAAPPVSAAVPVEGI